MGNTSDCDRRQASPAVHPHARGEHRCSAPRPASHRGSSPRPWGTLRAGVAGRLRVRFIPTPVGNTSSTVGPHLAASVHPHARGEHFHPFSRLSCTRGSSPRPWGTQTRQQPPKLPRRFIPTPVGNTWRLHGAWRVRSVHPHARGEHFFAKLCAHPILGSSPRPWGTRLGQRTECPPPRFIPTPVGNTSGARTDV